MSDHPDVTRPQPGSELLSWHDEWEASLERPKIVPVRTLFLRGGPCQFHCRMCDLWQYTHTQPTSAGAIAAQVRQGIECEPRPAGSDAWLKLYNASNFFDPTNVPLADLPDIAVLVRRFERVIVENHPKLLPWDIVESFRDAIAPAQLEIAMGLETVHPESLARLNKQMTVEDYVSAVHSLKQRHIDVRSFVLLGLPDLSHGESRSWCQRSIETALDAGASHVSIIPVRSQLGWLSRLQQQGRFALPLARSLEELVQQNLHRPLGIVTADLWGWHNLRGHCEDCSLRRRERLNQMNLYRQPLPAIACAQCDLLIDQ